MDDTILHYQSGNSRVLVLYHPALIAYRLHIGQGQVIVPRPAVTSVAGAGIRREADKTWRDYLTTRSDVLLRKRYDGGFLSRLSRIAGPRSPDNSGHHQGKPGARLMAGSQDIAEDPRNEAIKVWVNGTLVPRAQAKVSVFDGGFIAGEGFGKV